MATLTSLIKKAFLLILFKKTPPTCSYLSAFYRQAAPNFAYSFNKFEEKIPVYSFISAYLFIRELRILFSFGFQLLLAGNEVYDPRIKEGQSVLKERRVVVMFDFLELS